MKTAQSIRDSNVQLEEQMADLQANLDEVKEHEKEARVLLAKMAKNIA